MQRHKNIDHNSVPNTLCSDALMCGVAFEPIVVSRVTSVLCARQAERRALGETKAVDQGTGERG